MSLWSRFKSKVGLGAGKDAPPIREESAEAREHREALEELEGVTRAEDAGAGGEDERSVSVQRGTDQAEPLSRIGMPNGLTAEEAISLLRRLRGTSDESRALEAALRAPLLPGPVRVACAEMLTERGEDQRALEVLAGESSVEGLVLAADLHALRGELPRAVGAIERVLARQIDAPGARERHARWSETLGIAKRSVKRLDEATILNAQRSGGPFRILREVARGGAGTVYEAEDEVLGRRVAFKVYHGEAGDRGLIEREAKLLQMFAGRGVLRAFDAAPADGWMALEWVARGSLRDILKTGTVQSLLPIASWARSLAAALARIHRAGWVHADIKPANVLLRSTADTILTDFGIARKQGEGSSGGSPGYLSPERLGGEPASPLDDVYGFGRIIEDVLQAALKAPASLEPQRQYWEQIVGVCLGPATHRPMNGAQLASLMGDR